jgi:ribosomal protein L11 methyltransferase
LENYFYRVHLIGVDSDLEYEVIQVLIQNGASGSSESLTFSQPDLTFDPRVFKVRKKNLDVFFDQEPKSDLLQKVKEDFQIDSLQVFKEEHKDWLADWKKEYKPFIITSPYWVVPSWLESPTQDKYTLRIDPGMAFGTGTHATTQMAAHFVKQALSELSDGNAEVLDVGTGTGILAILSSKLGASMVTAIDIDPECLRVSNENSQLNQCSNILVESIELENLSGQFDLVIANIIDGVLRKLAQDLVRVTKPGGFLLLSGILLEHEDRFIENFIEAHSLKIQSRIEKEGWVSFLTRKAQD